MRVSVVTPSYNQAQFLGQCLDSVAAQRPLDVEHIVLDGASTDGSADLLRARADQLAYWRSEKDGGQAAAIREGFERATGEVLCWLNSDDFLEPGALQAVTGAFARNPAADIVYGDLRWVDREGRRLYETHLVLDLRILAYESPYVAQPAMFWRRGIYQKVGGVDPAFRFAMDYDLVVRMLRAGARSVKLRQILANFRVHETAKSSTLQAVCDEEVARVIAREGLQHGGPVSLVAKRWAMRAYRFARDPRGIASAVERRLRW